VSRVAVSAELSEAGGLVFLACDWDHGAAMICSGLNLCKHSNRMAENKSRAEELQEWEWIQRF